jgi:septal ring factor EnvC (AmiA/AmiB activator)
MLRRSWLLLLALACLCAAPAAADEHPELASWKERLEKAEAEVAKAHERVAAANAAYQHMRHDRSVRGEEKAKIIAERAEAEHAASDAQARLEALREQARRAGVPPNWPLPDPPADSPDGL